MLYSEVQLLFIPIKIDSQLLQQIKCAIADHIIIYLFIVIMWYCNKDNIGSEVKYRLYSKSRPKMLKCNQLYNNKHKYSDYT